MEHKKQAFNIIESICKLNNEQWNNKAGSYQDKTEAAYQIEEALEGFQWLQGITEALNNFDISERTDIQNHVPIKPTPKEISREIIQISSFSAHDVFDEKEIQDVDRFDKSIDAIYFAIGSMHKLGLSPTQIVEGIQVVHNANLAKSGEKDSNGKVIKTNDFLEPEPLLQKILDART